jgi:hypothetical protein
MNSEEKARIVNEARAMKTRKARVSIDTNVLFDIHELSDGRLGVIFSRSRDRATYNAEFDLSTGETKFAEEAMSVLTLQQRCLLSAAISEEVVARGYSIEPCSGPQNQ